MPQRILNECGFFFPVAIIAGLAVGIPVCIFGLMCVLYRLYCKKNRRQETIALGHGKKLWRKSYQIVGSSHESLSVPKHVPKIASKFVQDSPQMSSTSTSNRVSPQDDQLSEDDDDNSSLSNYRTAQDELLSPDCLSAESRDAVELISLSPVKTFYKKCNENHGYSRLHAPAQKNRNIPVIQVMNENKDILFKLDAQPNPYLNNDDNKIPVNLPPSVIQGKRTNLRSNLGMIDVSLLYKQTTCELYLKVIINPKTSSYILILCKSCLR